MSGNRFPSARDQPGQPGKGTETGRFSQPHAWGQPGQWGPSHTPCPLPTARRLLKLLPI